MGRRGLRPGGNKGPKTSSAGAGGGEALYDYNGLYEDHLNYTADYNEEFVQNYQDHYKFEIGRFVICVFVFFCVVVLFTEYFGRLQDKHSIA